MTLACYRNINDLLDSSEFIDGAVVGVNYDTPEFRSRLGIAFNAIHGMHQPSMNLKTYFVSIT
jgi:hypothetical protein